MFRWFGDQVRRFVADRIDRNMRGMGEQVVARARQLAPVRTGALRASIDYTVTGESGERPTLTISVGMPYGIFQEFGTRNMAPHPFIRPALIEAGRAWGFDLEASFAATPGHAGLLASTGRGARPGFAASSSPRFRALTPRQLHHVETRLRPSVRQLHRGNVKRTRFTVG